MCESVEVSEGHLQTTVMVAKLVKWVLIYFMYTITWSDHSEFPDWKTLNFNWIFNLLSSKSELFSAIQFKSILFHSNKSCDLMLVLNVFLKNSIHDLTM